MMASFEKQRAVDFSQWLKTLRLHFDATQKTRFTLTNDNNRSASEFNEILNFLSTTKVTALKVASPIWDCERFQEFLSRNEIDELEIDRDFHEKEIGCITRGLSTSKIKNFKLNGKFYDYPGEERIRSFILSVLRPTLIHLSSSATRLISNTSTASIFVNNLADLPMTSLTLDKYCFNVPFSTLFSKINIRELTSLSLRRTGLGAIELSKLSEFLQGSGIKKLDLGGNLINDKGADILAVGLRGSKVTNLNLSENAIGGNNDFGKCLQETSIVKLNLSKNKCRFDNMFNFPTFLKGSKVKVLNLHGCDLKASTCAEIIKSLAHTTLQKLNLSLNNLSISTFEELSKNIQHTQLTEIDFSRIPRFYSEYYTSLGDCLKNSTIRTLSINLPLSLDSDKESFNSFLEKTSNSEIRTLKIWPHYGCFPHAYPLDCLAKALAQGSLMEVQIEGLNMRKLPIGIADSLKLTSISRLTIRHAGLNDDGVKVLAASLAVNNLIYLDLSCNFIGSKGAKLLSLSLKESQLLYLNLSNNNIHKGGMRDLANRLEGTLILKLDVSFNPGQRALIVETALLKNAATASKIMNVFKRIAPKEKSNDFQFELDHTDGVDDFLNDCLVFYKMCTENRASVNLIAEDTSLPYSREEVKSMLSGFPAKFADFIGYAVEGDTLRHVQLLKKCEVLKLESLTALLLLNRPAFAVNSDKDILHPFVYTLLDKYKQPLCNFEIDPEARDKIINFLKDNMDLEGAAAALKLFRQTNISCKRKNSSNLTPRKTSKIKKVL